MKTILLPCFLLWACVAHTQTNVRAWYAQGQVWVVWQTAQPFPESFAVYKKASAFSNVSQASLIGRLYQYEYLPGTFIQQTGNPAFTYKIPTPDGSTYTLAPGEGLFVETVSNTGSSFYAVVEWGNTLVSAGVNGTPTAVAYTYDPVKEPVNCHLQLTLTLTSGHKTNWYCMWALGRQEQWAGRPDFPVMANAFKNGMPSMFIVSEAIGLDTSGGKKVPMTHFFHGSGMLANQFLANDFRVFNIEPLQGISVSHNDDFVFKTTTDTGAVFTTGRTLWFGWAKTHNPFNAAFDAGPGDTIVNYTQRRVLWIHQWLIRKYNIDPARVALQGYSMGSGGASALGKAFPNQFSTVCAFNNGFRSGADITSEHLMGSIDENLPTSLRRSPGDVVRINEVFDLTSRTSPQRDFPLFRTWAGKNDPNDRMHWGPDLVAQYRRADSLGLGAQISWDERFHVYDIKGMHWIVDLPAEQQTYRDNLSFQENFSSKQSFPAFFNHRLDPNNNDPGLGTYGVDHGDGDNWGTWGGYHNWDLSSLVDQPGQWAVSAWLTAGAIFDHDNCPADALRADLAIRKPQQFTPKAGSSVVWRAKDLATGALLQQGNAVVGADSLVVLPGIELFRENIRKVRIEVQQQAVATRPEPEWAMELRIGPNPSAGAAVLRIPLARAAGADWRVLGPQGCILQGRAALQAGENQLALPGLEDLPSGFYVVDIQIQGHRKALKWVKN